MTVAMPTILISTVATSVISIMITTRYYANCYDYSLPLSSMVATGSAAPAELKKCVAKSY